MSIRSGDVLIAAGAVVLVCAGMGVRLRRRPLEAGIPA